MRVVQSRAPPKISFGGGGGGQQTPVGRGREQGWGERIEKSGGGGGGGKHNPARGQKIDGRPASARIAGGGRRPNTAAAAHRGSFRPEFHSHTSTHVHPEWSLSVSAVAAVVVYRLVVNFYHRFWVCSVYVHARDVRCLPPYILRENKLIPSTFFLTLKS